MRKVSRKGDKLENGTKGRKLIKQGIMGCNMDQLNKEDLKDIQYLRKNTGGGRSSNIEGCYNDGLK